MNIFKRLLGLESEEPVDWDLREILTESTIESVRPWLERGECRLCGHRLVKHDGKLMGYIKCSSPGCIESFSQGVAREILRK